jgi:hypothetical protein
MRGIDAVHAFCVRYRWDVCTAVVCLRVVRDVSFGFCAIVCVWLPEKSMKDVWETAHAQFKHNVATQERWKPQYIDVGDDGEKGEDD